MKLLFGLAIVIACNLAEATEITATGNGSSFNDALQNAKVLATEYVASTFVTGHREVVNGKYKEVLGQYNGGLIKTYVVKDTTVTAGVYAVTILADVNTDKVNQIITTGNEATNNAVPQVEKAVDEYQKTAAAWVAINEASLPFAVVINNTNYSVYNGTTVDVVYHMLMQWNPKWIDDAKQLAKAINRSPVSGEGISAICFKSTTSGVCSGVLALPNTKHWTPIEFIATVHFNSGATETHRLHSTAAQLLYRQSLTKIQLPGLFGSTVTLSALNLYENETSPFDLILSFDVEKFKTVSTVTIDPVF